MMPFKKESDQHHWLTISDLMSGLMILFIFIAVSFMRSTILEKDRANDEFSRFKELERKYELIISEKADLNRVLTKYTKLEEQYQEINKKYLLVLNDGNKAKDDLNKVKAIAQTYQENQEAIYTALKKAFPDSLLSENQLNAEIDKNTLTFIFKSSDSLFGNGDYKLKEDYKLALKKFFPLYIKAIMPYKESINEIRIEGHTSSEWGSFPKEIKNQPKSVLELYGYFENMKLSQARTNSVLSYILSDLKYLVLDNDHKWLRDHTSAVGLSSSKPILKPNGEEDFEKSRRVTFRILTNADSKIQQILQE